MAIETLDDVIEGIADLVGVYGAHDERCSDERKSCRCCFTSSLKRRICDAVEIENRLNYSGVSAGKERG